MGVSALRELLNLVYEGDQSRSTYAKAFALGQEVVPELLGRDVSILRREQSSRTVKEYRQRAALLQQTGQQVTPVGLLERDIDEDARLIDVARNQEEASEIRHRQMGRMDALRELLPIVQTETPTINRDFYTANRALPPLHDGPQYRDFALHDGAVLRLRVTHPEYAERITGADVIYERHYPQQQRANIVGVQYKIWEGNVLPLGDERLQSQLARMKGYFCDRGLCQPGSSDHTFRFPFCSAFLRPTDKLQSPDQKLRSSGEHIPICQIDAVATTGPRGGKSLRFESMRGMSLKYDVFENLFNSGKLGSRTLTYNELAQLYQSLGPMFQGEHLVIHAQDLGREAFSDIGSPSNQMLLADDGF